MNPASRLRRWSSADPNPVMATIGVRLEAWIVRRQQAGAMRRCDPWTIIFAVVGMAQTFGMHKYMYQRTEPLQSDEEVIDAFASILINGVRAPKPETAIKEAQKGKC